MTDTFLVYDGRNWLFRAGARQVARLSDETRLVPWRAEQTQRFLEAQFGDHLFAFALIDPDAGVVHVGEETVRRVLRDRGVPRPVTGAAEWLYATLGDSFGRVVHKQTPADIDGTFPIAEDAEPHVRSLRRECSLASCDPTEL